MNVGTTRLLLAVAGAALLMAPVAPAVAQDQDGLGDLKLPGITNFTHPGSNSGPASSNTGEITLSAQLTPDGADITRGIVWRVFRPEPGDDGKLHMVASAHGGTADFQLEPGSYLVHAAYGRAGATKRITVGKE